MIRNHDSNDDELPPELLDTLGELLDAWGQDLDRMTRRWVEEPDGLLIDLVETGCIPSPPLPDEDQ